MTLFSDKRFCQIFAAFVAIGIGIGFFFFPAIADDLGFMHPFRDYFEGESNDFLTPVISSIRHRYLYDNARFANVIMILTATWPRWIVQIFSIIAVFYILCICAKIGKYNDRLAIFVLWCGLFLIFFPWIDQMYIVDFQLNYIWGTTISLIIVNGWLKNKKIFSWALWFWCLIIGFWHETFAGGVLVSLIALIILYPKFRRRNQVIYTLSIIPGILYLMFPRMGGNVWLYFADRQSFMLIMAIPLFVLIILWVATYLKKKSRASALDSNIMALCILGTSGILFMLLIPLGPRTGALGCTTSLAGCCSLIAVLIPRKNILELPVFILFVVFILAHITAVDIECYRAGKATEEAIKSYRLEPDKTHFVDITLRINAPFICIQKPYYDWFGHSSAVKIFNKFYGIDGEPFRIAPKELEHIDILRLKPIAGTAKMNEYDNRLLVGPSIGQYPSTTVLDLTTSTGRIQREFYVVPLGSPSHLAWYYPNNSWLWQVFSPSFLQIDYVE